MGDFFQLNPVKQRPIYHMIDLGDSWRLFHIHELHDIVRQSGDPHFANEDLHGMTQMLMDSSSEMPKLRPQKTCAWAGQLFRV